ncbi:MAG: recombination mediator RecR [Myxococcota bacterium]|nr:recombination mediator RecR [Myxococcota bacterium]
MKNAPDPIRRLVHALTRLPGIGEKSAQRLSFFIVNADDYVATDLADALVDVRHNVGLCQICGNLTQTPTCLICEDTRRDKQIICIVESVPTLYAVESTGEFKGLYHVLHGVLSPLDGIGPEQLNLKTLMSRLAEVDEIIVATNPSVEGEATALYIQRLCSPLGIKVSRIASGVPMGSDLEYADQVTLARAFEGRREI